MVVGRRSSVVRVVLIKLLRAAIGKGICAVSLVGELDPVHQSSSNPDPSRAPYPSHPTYISSQSRLLLGRACIDLISPPVAATVLTVFGIDSSPTSRPKWDHLLSFWLFICPCTMQR